MKILERSAGAGEPLRTRACLGQDEGRRLKLVPCEGLKIAQKGMA